MSQKRPGRRSLAAAVLFAAACPVALWAQETAPKPAEAQPAPPSRPQAAQAANIQLAVMLTDKVDAAVTANPATPNLT